MIKQYVFVISILFFTTACSTENDFDKLCGYYKDLSGSSKQELMSKAQNLEFINKKVQKGLKETSQARQAWEVVVYAVPEERYDIFKSTTVELLGTEWACKEMQALMPITGE